MVAQLVEAPSYQPEGYGFDSQLGYWDFSLTTLWPLGSTQLPTEIVLCIPPGGKGSWCVWLTALPPSCAYCLEVVGASTSWNHKGLARPIQGLL